MKAVLLGAILAVTLTACGLQSTPPPVETVTKEPVGQVTDKPIENDGHGFRTPPSVSGKPPFVYPVYPPSGEPSVQADPVPEFKPKADVSGSKSEKKPAKKAHRPPLQPVTPGVSDKLFAQRQSVPIDDILGQLRQGNMAFKVQSEMFIDEQSEATLVIDTTTTQKELEALIGPGASGGTLLVSKIIVTKLIAPSFEITNVTPERQALIDGQPTKWQWLLKPLEQGKHKVTLSVTAVLKVDGQSVERFIVTFERDIFVHVTVQNRLSKFWHNNWQWLIGTLVLPLAAWLWHRRRKRA